MKILVVDDSRAMRSIVLRALREMGLRNHTFLEASNGREALQTVRESQPELVICDLNMPEMNGLELLRTLKENNSPSRFGFVTSEVSSKLKSEAQEAGALFVLTKPFTVAAFSQTIGPVVESLGSGPLSDCDEATAERAPAGSGGFHPSHIGRLLTSLTRKRIHVRAVPPLPLPPQPGHFVAEYLLEHNSVVACGIGDLAFAARIGAALTLIPPAVAAEALKTRQLTEMMQGNLHEVLNVVSQSFGAEGKNAVSLGKVHLPGDPLPPELTSRLTKPGTRLDVRVEIDTYGEGNLTLLTLPVPA